MTISRRAMIAQLPAGMLCAMAAPAAARSGRSFGIVRYGAVGDGRTLNTLALQRAIDACAAAGGGMVVIPRGVFVSGSIFLKPGVGLELRKGAVLRGSSDLVHYPLVLRRFAEADPEPLRMALVNAAGNQGLRIVGPGTLDGGGEPFWRRFFDDPGETYHGQRVKYPFPQLCFLQDCNDVVIRGVNFRDPAFWMLHLYRCRKVVVEDCRFEVPHKIRAPSSDGTDIDSCQDVTIRRCHYSVDDDCIALKGTQGEGAAAHAEAPPVERIHIHDCVFEAGLGAVSFGSNATIVRDVRIERCTNRGDMPVIRFKVRPNTPGQIYERIRARGIRLVEPAGGAWHGGEQFLGYSGPPLGADEPQTGLIVNARLIHGTDVPARAPGAGIRDVVIEDVTGTTEGFGDISANATTSISDIVLRNIDVTLTDPARTRLVARGVRNLRLDNVRVNGAPALVER